MPPSSKTPARSEDPRPQPTPEDPRKNAPVKDPPVDPEHDAQKEPVRQANSNENEKTRWPDQNPVIIDAEDVER
jgi:hypothetical protein